MFKGKQDEKKEKHFREMSARRFDSLDARGRAPTGLIKQPGFRQQMMPFTRSKPTRFLIGLLCSGEP